MPTLHEAVANEMAENWRSQPDGEHVLTTVERQIKRRFWSTEYRDAIGQPFGGWNPGQVASFAYIHAGISKGSIGRVMIRASGVPARDRERESNAAGLQNLPDPFEAWVDPRQTVDASGDGSLEWFESIEIDVATGEIQVEDDGSTRLLTTAIALEPSWMPLEIGSTAASRTLLHFMEHGGVARWPYGHEWITLLVGLEPPFHNPAKILADRLRWNLAEKSPSPESLRDEPLPNQDESDL